MDIRKVTDDFSVAPQLHPDELAAVAGQGFRSIICNRPDGESPDQPSFAAIEAAAQSAGLETRYIPVRPGGISEDDVQAFASALAALPGPILAYCRSGARSATVWSLSQATNRPEGAGRTSGIQR